VQVADHNLRVTLEAIRRDGPLTRLELARRSGLTVPGLTNILRRLGSDGLVCTSQRRGSGGQPSIQFALCPDGAYAVGVRLRRTRVEAVLVDLGGQVRERLMIDPIPDPTTAVRQAVDTLRDSPTAPPKLAGVGLALDGTTLPDVAALRAALAPLPLHVERDCVTAVLAERTLGVGLVDGGVMLIIIDDTVRAGFLVQGAPFAGVHRRAGSIGAMRTGSDRVPLDSVAGLEALRRRLSPTERAALAGGQPLPLTSAVQGWINDTAGHLLDAIVATAGFMAPGAILIGGDLPRNVVEALIAQMLIERGDGIVRPHQSPWMSSIRPASFDAAGIALGAALLPFFDLLLPPPVPAV
jgi:predicted NBD/HSP70 family sugar kinase